MKIVFATGIFPPDVGGPATYVSHLAPELAARGHQVEVVTYERAAREPGAVTEPAGNPVTRVRRSRPLPLRYGAYFAAVRRVARGADLVYLQDPVSAGVPGLAAARSRRVPALLKVVGDLAWEISTEAGWVRDDVDLFQRRRYTPWVEALRRAEHAVARRADAVVVPSAYLAGIVRGWGVPEHKLAVIENAVPPPKGAESREQARRALGLDADVVVASAGRLLPHKGLDLLISATAAIASRFPSLKVVVAGDGPCRSALSDQARAAGLAETVWLPGTLDARGMNLLYRASDVFVLLSTYEGRSHVLLEALQAGLPVVASDIAGNRELLHGRPNTFLVPRESGAVAAAMRNALEEPRAASRADDAAWPRMVSRTLHLMERTCRR